MTPPDSLPEDYGRALAGVGSASLASLHALEAAERRLHPPDLPQLRAHLTPLAERSKAALRVFRASAVPEGLAEFHDHLSEAGERTEEALAAFLDAPPAPRAVSRILDAMRARCEAQRLFYPLRHALAPLGRYFVEEAFHDRLEHLDPDPPEGVRVGILEAPGDEATGRGGFTLYVPETYRGDEDRPLVIALHGGSGHGRDFLWTWLREARGRGFLLLSPSSVGPTWSLDAPWQDGGRLRTMVEFVAERYRVDHGRVLVTGLSDGATFSLLWGLGEASPATHIAPVSGVLHPSNFGFGNLERADGRPIHLTHGGLDWMFPVALARMASEELTRAGAALVYRELDDLSHTYPREENDHILTWFDPSLALPS
jgi:phospholipase/carboxylesterase